MVDGIGSMAWGSSTDMGMFKRLIAIVGVGIAATAAPAGAQTLRYAASAPLLSMDPHATNDFVTQMVMTQIYESLVKVDPDLSLQPGLALSWEHRGGLVWRFKLRPDVKFHDGSALVPSDVVFSIARARRAFLVGLRRTDRPRRDRRSRDPRCRYQGTRSAAAAQDGAAADHERGLGAQTRRREGA